MGASCCAPEKEKQADEDPTPTTKSVGAARGGPPPMVESTSKIVDANTGPPSTLEPGAVAQENQEKAPKPAAAVKAEDVAAKAPKPAAAVKAENVAVAVEEGVTASIAVKGRDLDTFDEAKFAQDATEAVGAKLTVMQVQKSLLSKKSLSVTVNVATTEAVSKLHGANICGYEVSLLSANKVLSANKAEKPQTTNIMVKGGDLDAFDEAKFAQAATEAVGAEVKVLKVNKSMLSEKSMIVSVTVATEQGVSKLSDAKIGGYEISTSK